MLGRFIVRRCNFLVNNNRSSTAVMKHPLPPGSAAGMPSIFVLNRILFEIERRFIKKGAF